MDETNQSSVDTSADGVLESGETSGANSEGTDSGELSELRQLAGEPLVRRYAGYTRKTGPGWLQSAITLGGGSLAGSLYLGVLGGFSLLWLQPLAMILGIIMLSSISYVTLTTGKRPFRAICDHVNPVLGWGWLIATLMANVVWCMPQFALGTAAVQQNLVPALDSSGGKVLICLFLLLAAGTVIWFYDTGSRGVKLFEVILKCMVGMIVLCFFGVVVKMSFSAQGLPWGDIVKGFVPDIKLMVRPAATFDAALAATGNFADFWTARIVGMQRDVMITAAATAVGINMTFLLPYSMLRKGWTSEYKELALFDLAIGLFVPFFLATSCVVIASASQFHATPEPGLLDGNAPAALVGQYEGLLKARITHENGQLSADEAARLIPDLPEADRRMAAMLVKRDAFNLADSLKGLTGGKLSQYIFGFGVLGMALSTIIILMLINGFTICEMFGLPATGVPHRIGCYIAGIGVIGPFVWKGAAKFWLAVPTSVFGMALLPIAYITFFLMMNSRGLMGKDRLQGTKRVIWNFLMLVALGLAGIGAGYAIWSKVRWVGVGIVVVFLGLALIVHFVHPPVPVEAEAQSEPDTE